MTDEADEIRNAARREIHEALGRYADSWDDTEGGIVTAFVCVVEVASPDGLRGLIRVYGGGADGSDVPADWLRLGMLQYAIDSDRAQA